MRSQTSFWFLILCKLPTFSYLGDLTTISLSLFWNFTVVCLFLWMFFHLLFSVGPFNQETHAFLFWGMKIILNHFFELIPLPFTFFWHYRIYIIQISHFLKRSSSFLILSVFNLFNQFDFKCNCLRFVFHSFMNCFISANMHLRAILKDFIYLR